MGFPNIPDNEIEVIKNHVAEIFIIADMGGLQHFQMRVVFAGAIPFNDFMPDSIDKGVEVLNLHGGNPIYINLNVRKKLDKVLMSGKLTEQTVVNPTAFQKCHHGHNRFTIAKKHPEIPFTVHEKEFANRYEAIIWICKNQLGRRNLTPEQKSYLIGKQYEAEKHADFNRGNQYTSSKKSGCYQNGNSQKLNRTCERIASENGIGRNTVIRAEQFAKGVDAAEEAVPGTRQKVLSGEVKPTAAEIASVARAPPEERPALVAAICKAKEPKPLKPPAPKQKTPPAVAAPLPDASTSDEEAPDEESTSTPAPPESTFPQRVNESLKIDRQQLLEIANNRYHVKQIANGAAMLCEVSGAANTMIRRWESVFRDYPDILTDAKNRSAVKRNIQKVKDYLQKLEDKI